MSHETYILLTTWTAMCVLDLTGFMSMAQGAHKFSDATRLRDAFVENAVWVLLIFWIGWGALGLYFAVGFVLDVARGVPSALPLWWRASFPALMVVGTLYLQGSS